MHHWNIAADAQNVLVARYRPIAEKIAASLGLDVIHWTTLTTALSYEPDPISSARMAQRNPYTLAAVLNQRLAHLAELGFLAKSGVNEYRLANEYRLTDAGRQAARRLGEQLQAMNQFTGIPFADLEQLALLLRRVIEAFERADAPASKWAFTRVRRLRAPHAEPVADIYFSLGEMNAFRDDCHLSAWRAHSMNGPLWETLTLIWRGEAQTLYDLVQKLKPRGHSLESLASAVEDLKHRGWVEEQGSMYRTTEAGKTVRQAVEAQTDQIFYASWRVLTDAEQKEVEDLLMRFRDALKQ